MEKTPRDSYIETAQLVLPNDTNLLGDLMGGRLMHWMDIAGALAASRHANRVVATVAIDAVEFRHPVRMGEMIRLKASVVWVGRTSMDVEIEAFAENLRTGAVILTNKALMTFVALDDGGKPVEAPRLLLETDDDRERFARAEKRKKCRC